MREQNKNNNATNKSTSYSQSSQSSGMKRTWDKFHNPYHFVPAKRNGRINDMCVTAFDDRQLNHLTHDRYVDNSHSGRIICCLTAETPFFVGDERKIKAQEHLPAEVFPFEIDSKPAIPATSLRGLISNIAEAASNSALRVLENRYLSRRADYQTESLGAIGMIIIEKDTKGKDIRKLRPLCLPQLKWEQSKKGYYVEPKYQVMFRHPLLKVYIDGYRKKYRNGQAVQPPEIERKRDTFLAKKNPNSYSADKDGYWYLKLGGTCSMTTNKTVTATAPHEKNHRLLGQKAAADEEPISESEYKRQENYIRGIIRVLGIDGGREKQIPTSKTHEIFIPYPIGIEKEPTFDCEKAAQHFEFLAAERTRENTDFPFHNKGSNRNAEQKDKEKSETYNIKLRDGDIVFFEPDKNDYSKVGEVSISSIWRRSAGGTSHDYFRAISPELLPFNAERKTITLAEQIFGFVEQDFSSDKSQLKNRQARALAGRLRFSNALFRHCKEGKDKKLNYYLNPVTLKILDSPKPPSPALYFKHNNGTGNYISKQELSAQRHYPQGRKFYIHQKMEGNPWETRRPNDPCKQKVKVTPVIDGAVFYFHIDFDNLSDIELGLLLYSLSPSDTFHHKLGMGKPIGLGTVKIKPVGLFTINRKERYYVKTDEDIFTKERKRYHKGWVHQDTSVTLWQALYPQEIQDYMKGLEQIDCFKLRDDFTDKIDKDIKKALELLGNPDNLKAKVHYPQLSQKDIEDENFRWFMNNDDRNNPNKQYLKPSDLTELS